jgi:type I site-specific restriction-modification system R (restriction) subunit
LGNGIPVATAELKTDNTQSIADAIWQYQTDRDPRPAGQASEPLLSFPSGALVHFAVSNREVQMTTWLLLRAVLQEGPGWRYLIQHSAGSGKTASIGWSAHLLADLHDGADRKVFDTVLVVSDRSVIESQLQETLENFERRKGVVASITNEKGIKSEQLAAALSGDKLKQVLSAAEVADLADGGEVDIETLLAAQMGARGPAKRSTPSGGAALTPQTAFPDWR